MTAGTDVEWHRLHSRLIWVNGARFLLSLLPSAFSLFAFGSDPGFIEVWPFLVATCVGVLASLTDLLRWMRTRYRITDDLVEIHTGRIVRKYRSVPRDRIRTVDRKAKLRHRLSGLRVIVISSGGTKAPIRLDAVTKTQAEDLRHRLLRGHAVQDGAKADETIIAELRWPWIFYNMFNIWGVVVVMFLPLSLQPLLQLAGIDLLGLARNMIEWNRLDMLGSATLVVGMVICLSSIVLVAGFVKDNWNFQLLRAETANGSSLVTRQGLFTTREIYREDHRIRGVHISQPLFWRWVGLTETSVISTGLAGWSLSDTEIPSTILPRAPIGDALRVAGLVLQDDTRPLEAPLTGHPSAAFKLRAAWAFALPGAMVGLSLWLAETGAIPGWGWLIPATLPPITLLAAVIAYRTLGHTIAGTYIVLRSGLFRCDTTVLQQAGILGWTVRQSIAQRYLGLLTVGVSTAAGERYYQAPDFGAAQAIAFAYAVNPELIAEFIHQPGLESRSLFDPSEDEAQETVSSTLRPNRSTVPLSSSSTTRIQAP